MRFSISTIGAATLSAILTCNLLMSTSRADDSRMHELRGSTMGTTYSIKFFAAGAIDLADVQTQVAQRLSEIDERMSTYRDDSELSRFNDANTTEWFAVSAETARLVQLAQQIAADTDGAFDVTVGPLVELWKFGPARGAAASFRPPSEQEIQQTMASVGYAKLHVRLEPPALKKDVATLTVDLSAIAKGYGVDQVVKVVQSLGAERLMVEIGGEVKVIGGRTDQEPWRIGVEAPCAEARSLQTVIPLRDQAMATSGDYRNFYEHEGVRYSHTIDPRLGRPVRHALASATLLASDCAQADAWATALLVMGPDDSKTWADQRRIAALLLVRTDNDQIQHIHSATFPVSRPTVSPRSSETAGGGFLPLALISGAVFAIAILAMAVGVIFSNRRLQGSCGGLAGMKDEHGQTLCQACRNPSPECLGVDKPAVTDDSEPHHSSMV